MVTTFVSTAVAAWGGRCALRGIVLMVRISFLIMNERHSDTHSGNFTEVPGSNKVRRGQENWKS